MKKALLTGSFALCFLILFASLLCAFLTAAAVNTDQMAADFQAYSITPGVEEDQYPALAKALTLYLSGDRESAQLAVVKNGEEADAFNEKELAHLKDVRGLVRVGVIVRYAGLLPLALCGLGMFLYYKKTGDKAALKPVERGFILSVCVSFLALIALVVYSLCDFDDLFAAFHRVFFTNDLWLLDPNTDLLLQLMPTPFFTAVIKRLLIRVIPLALCLLLAAGALFFAGRGKQRADV